MDFTFVEKRTITSLQIKAKAGSFAKEGDQFYFEECREKFAPYFTDKTNGFYFKHGIGQVLGVARFVLKTEKILKLPEHSRFGKTNRKTILWVEPSTFWKTCEMRQSLYTLILRAGLCYVPEQDNYESALLGEEFIKHTKDAIARFLFGFTKYRGPALGGSSTLRQTGWHHIFSYASKKTIRSYLVAPDVDKYNHLRDPNGIDPLFI